MPITCLCGTRAFCSRGCVDNRAGDRAHNPRWSVGCSPGADHLPRPNRDRDLRLGSRSGVGGLPAVAGRARKAASPTFPDRARRGAGAVKRGGLEMRFALSRPRPVEYRDVRLLRLSGRLGAPRSHFVLSCAKASGASRVPTRFSRWQVWLVIPPSVWCVVRIWKRRQADFLPSGPKQK
jgi:hypothetical protein